MTADTGERRRSHPVNKAAKISCGDDPAQAGTEGTGIHMEDIILQVENISKNFGMTQALKDVGFTIRKGNLRIGRWIIIFKRESGMLVFWERM